MSGKLIQEWDRGDQGVDLLIIAQVEWLTFTFKSADYFFPHNQNFFFLFLSATQLLSKTRKHLLLQVQNKLAMMYRGPTQGIMAKQYRKHCQNTTFLNSIFLIFTQVCYQTHNRRRKKTANWWGFFLPKKSNKPIINSKLLFFHST